MTANSAAVSIAAAGLAARIDALAAISEQPAPVVTRVLFSEADLRARAHVEALCRAQGLALRHDGAGNLFARWEGSEPDLPAVATGSHIDAIPNAGRFDGVVGVLGAIEAVAALKRAGFRPRRSVELIVFTAEEPTRFGLGCLGSRLLSGLLSPATAASLADADGRTFENWRTAAGYGDRSLADVRLVPGCYAAFVELHIEQGPLLESLGIDVGAVEKIAGPATLRMTLTGEGGHAGAVLMPERRDAFLAGAEIALAVENAARQSASADTVATTGVCRIRPGAVNSVPCEALLEVDVRGTSLADRDKALDQIRAAAAAACGRRQVGYACEVIHQDPPALCDDGLVALVERAAAAEKCSSLRMVSRAYHDTLFMAQVCPSTMIFIPCRKGYSHRPDEYASPEQIAHGVTILAAVLRELSR
jgi:N-carbamoyl-L-amino-acid hydrolase